MQRKLKQEDASHKEPRLKASEEKLGVYYHDYLNKILTMF